ncbi:MAG: hypothetical protein KKA81_11590 [Bacteroidetes bacterium]|nr:hypothetical protein [Bacteroidota bacterium]
MKKTLLWKTCLLAILSFAIASTGCKKDHDSEEVAEEENFDPIIPPTTKVVTEDDCDRYLESIDTSNVTITFKKEILDHYSFEVGDVITLPVDGGYIREITGIDEQKNGIWIIIYTKFSSLIKAINQGRADYNFPLDFTGAKTIYHDKGIECTDLKENGMEAMYHIDKVLYQNGNNVVRVTGDFTLGATIYGTVQIKNFSLHKFSYNNDIGEQIDLQGSCTFDILTWEDEVKLLSHEFPSIPMVIGGVPFILTPVMDVFAGASVELQSQITTSIHQEFTLKTGATYYLNNWTPHADVVKTINGQEPTCSSSADFQVWVRPQIRMMIDRILSPKISEKFYGQLTVNTLADPWWVLCSGLDVNLGIQMEFFDEADWGLDVIKLKDTLYKADGPFGNSTLVDSIKDANHFSSSFKVWYEEQDRELLHWMAPPNEFFYYRDYYTFGNCLGVYDESIQWNGNQFTMLIWFHEAKYDTNYYSISGTVSTNGKVLKDIIYSRSWIFNDSSAPFATHKHYESIFKLDSIPLEKISGNSIRFKTENEEHFQNIFYNYYIQTRKDGALHEERWITNVSDYPVPDKDSYISIWFMKN